MPIVLDITLLTDSYDAGGGTDPRSAEWPPHPARVFSALRAVAEPDDRDLLLRLERLGSPVVWASKGAYETQRSGYVVTNRIEPKGGHLTHPGRTSGLRERRATVPDSSRIRLVWHEGLPDQDVRRLDAVAARVPYLGRATSTAMLAAAHEPREREIDGLSAFRPCRPEDADTWLRTPYPGYTEELEALYDAGLSAWQASDTSQAVRPYRSSPIRTDGEDLVAVVSPYQDLVVLRFIGARPDGVLIPRLVEALRRRVMGQTRDPLPPALHGHGYDGHPHVAYLGLPDVGHPFADGHVVALAVAVPHLDQAARREVIRGVLAREAGGEVQLRVPGIGVLELRHEPELRRPWTARPERWCAASRSWASATPVVLDHFPRDRDVEREISESCVRVGLPAPARIVTSVDALTEGAVRLRPHDLPKRARGRLYRHVLITFDRPVAGPVLLGAGRYFGVGLLAPVADPLDEAEGGDDRARRR